MRTCFCGRWRQKRTRFCVYGLDGPKMACRTCFCGVPNSAEGDVHGATSTTVPVSASSNMRLLRGSVPVSARQQVAASAVYVYIPCPATRIRVASPYFCVGPTTCPGCNAYPFLRARPRQAAVIRWPATTHHPAAYPILRRGIPQKRTHFCATSEGRGRIRGKTAWRTRFCEENCTAQTIGWITGRHSAP